MRRKYKCKFLGLFSEKDFSANISIPKLESSENRLTSVTINGVEYKKVVDNPSENVESTSDKVDLSKLIKQKIKAIEEQKNANLLAAYKIFTDEIIPKCTIIRIRGDAFGLCYKSKDDYATEIAAGNFSGYTSSPIFATSYPLATGSGFDYVVNLLLHNDVVKSIFCNYPELDKLSGQELTEKDGELFLELRQLILESFKKYLLKQLKNEN